jgi:tetratricopeptide (TPR) repeat protein
MKLLPLIFAIFEICIASQVLVMNRYVDFEKPNQEDWLLKEYTFDPILRQGNLIYLHRGLENQQGEVINPSITLHFEKLNSDDIGLIPYIAQSRMKAKESELIKIHSNDNSEISLGLLYETRTEHNGKVFRVFTNYFLNKDIGFQVTAVSTENIYPLVQEDFMKFFSELKVPDNFYNESIENSIKKGYNYFENGHWAEALGHYNYCLISDSLYNDTYYYSALLYGKIGHFSKSIELFSKSILIAPNDPYSYGDRGSLYAQNGYPDKALPDLKKAYELMPMHPHYLMNLAACYSQLGNIRKAKETFSKAIEINPENIFLYINRAQLYLDERKYTSAFSDYGKVIAIIERDDEKSLHPLIKMELANCYFKQGIIKNALDDTQAAIFLLRKSRELGHPKAKAKLEELENE